MSIAHRLLTYADLVEMPDDGRRYEIVDGELVVAAAPNPLHQLCSFRLQKWFDAYVEPRGCGLGLDFAAVDVELSRHTVVEPDLAFVSTARFSIIADTRLIGVPDLVVEFLSPSTLGYDAGLKAKTYQDAGVPEYWMVDLNARQLPILALVNGVYQPVPEHRPGEVRSLVLPGFVVDVAALFANLIPGRD